MVERTSPESIRTASFGDKTFPRHAITGRDNIQRIAAYIEQLEGQLAEALYKAEKYDAVVKALSVCDGGRYRNDTIESCILSLAERDRLAADVTSLKAVNRSFDLANQRLTADNARKDAALRPIAKIADIEDSIGTEDGESIMINVKLCRQARAALASVKGE